MKATLLCAKGSNRRDIEVLPYDDEYDQVLSDIDLQISGWKTSGSFEVSLNRILSLDCPYFIECEKGEIRGVSFTSVRYLRTPEGALMITFKFLPESDQDSTQ